MESYIRRIIANIGPCQFCQNEFGELNITRDSKRICDDCGASCLHCNGPCRYGWTICPWRQMLICAKCSRSQVTMMPDRVYGGTVIKNSYIPLYGLCIMCNKEARAIVCPDCCQKTTPQEIWNACEKAGLIYTE